MVIEQLERADAALEVEVCCAVVDHVDFEQVNRG
jgi:hypothetical protein